MSGRRRREPKGASAIGGLLVVVVIHFWSTENSLSPFVVAAAIVAFTAAVALNLVLRRREAERLRLAGIDEIDRMTGEQFEQKLAVLFRQQGYHVETTPKFGDSGADLILSRKGERVIVEADCWKNAVGVKAVQGAVGAVPHYDGQRAMVVTNSTFTVQATNLARSSQRRDAGP